MLHDLKNWCRAKTVEKCSIDKIWLIKYNRIKLCVRIYELKNNEKK